MLTNTARRLISGLITAALVGTFSSSGCNRPDPPVLQQGLEVYRDENEGFSFRPPPGWAQAARARVLKEDRKQDTLLVKYKHGAGNQIAFLQVSAVDLPEDTDVTAFLDKTLTREEKRTSKKAEDLQVGGLKATRDTFTTKWGRDTMTREIVAVRRGPRVYFFTATFPPDNKSIRDASRKVLESVTWSGG